MVGGGLVLVPELAVVPPVDRQEGRGARVRRRRGRRDQRHAAVLGRIGPHGVDRALGSQRREHQQIARTVHRQVHRVQRIVAHHLQAARLCPAVDALEAVLDEIERPRAVRRAAGDRPEAALQLRDRRAHAFGRRGRRVGRDIEHGELARAHLQVVGLLLDGVLERELAGAQEGAAAVRIAVGVPALRIDVHVAEPDVVRVEELHRRHRGMEGPGHAIAVIVGDQYVAGVADLQGDRVHPLGHFLFGLRRQELPVAHVVEHDLVADVVLVRQLVDVAGRGRVGYVEAGLGEGVGRPHVGEGPAAAVRHPDAGVLRVQPVVGDGIAAVAAAAVQRLAVRGGGAAAAHDLDVVHQGGFGGAPHQRGGARVHPAGEQADPRHDVVAPARRLHQRDHTAHAGEGGAVVARDQLGERGVKAQQHGVGPQPQRARHHVEAGWQVQHPVRVDRALQRRGVVGLAVATHAQVAHAGPGGDRRQGADRGRADWGRPVQGRHVDGGLVAADLPQPRQGQPVAEGGHAVGRPGAWDALSTVAEAGEGRGGLGHGVLEADLGVGVVLVGDDHAGAADALEPHVLAPQPVAVARVDVDPHRGVPDRHVDQGQPRLVLAYGRLALAVEARVDQGELPRRRRSSR